MIGYNNLNFLPGGTLGTRLHGLLIEATHAMGRHRQQDSNKAVVIQLVIADSIVTSCRIQSRHTS